MNFKHRIERILGPELLGTLDYLRYPSLKDGFGGPFNGQTLRQRIFVDLIGRVRFDALVETGTYYGTTTEYLHLRSGLPLWTVELDRRCYGYARWRFMVKRGIHVQCGDSRVFLRALAAKPALAGKQLFFYLDAHWGEDLPLRDEVEIIFQNWPRAVAMIDDFAVPFDAGYAFDDYGAGKALTLEYLQRPDLTALFPAQGSAFESGEKRGCVVLVKATDLIEKVADSERLVLYRA